MQIKALQEIALHLAGSGTNSLSWKISELTELVYWIVCWSELCFMSHHYDSYNRALVVQVEPIALHYHYNEYLATITTSAMNFPCHRSRIKFQESFRHLVYLI